MCRWKTASVKTNFKDNLAKQVTPDCCHRTVITYSHLLTMQVPQVEYTQPKALKCCNVIDEKNCSNSLPLLLQKPFLPTNFFISLIWTHTSNPFLFIRRMHLMNITERTCFNATDKVFPK